ncbi:hypothetical protein HMPREF3212_03258 [Citrobacter freundii]|uniref:Uncharacterized protein n=1 Tax=Citrobacter freundii TaxID=546 RepID=A0A133LBX2_CITFR|nr:hypothetical protein AB07_0691 [Citrobacter freundii]KWZ89388.1 hypothetical protein HMPREF3212_03258 [Citrobacter freundii]CDL40287.1 hypothetical protein [Citrobacter freundii]
MHIYSSEKNGESFKQLYFLFFQIVSAFAQTREPQGISTKTTGINICSEK